MLIGAPDGGGWPLRDTPAASRWGERREPAGDRTGERPCPPVRSSVSCQEELANGLSSQQTPGPRKPSRRTSRKFVRASPPLRAQANNLWDMSDASSLR